ncbi:hypothetical protein ACTFIW_000298 [Dictyostelium discoideum]
MDQINEPPSEKLDSKRQLLNSAILGVAMFFILLLNFNYYPYFISNIQAFFINSLSIVGILMSYLIIRKLRIKIPILISTLILLIVFLITFNVSFPISFISYVIQPFANNLLLIAAGTYIMTISDKSNIGKNFGLFFFVTSFLNGLFSVSTASFYRVSQIVYILFMVVSVVLVLLLKNPNWDQNDNITVTRTDPQSFLNAIVYPMGICADKKFLLLVPAIFLLGTVSFLFPYGLVHTQKGDLFQLYTKNENGAFCFLGAVVSILFGFLFDRFEKKYLLYAIIIVGAIGATLNIGFVHKVGLINLAFASFIFNTIAQYGFKVLVFSLLGSTYLDCKSLPANICYQFLSTLAFLFIDLTFFYISSIACFYIYFLILILACIGIFKFLSSNNDKEQISLDKI